PYEHDLKRGGAPPDKRNVATSGCGICSLCMIVENLTDRRLSVEEAIALSYACGANEGVGTTMRLLGPYAAEKLGLIHQATDSLEELLSCLKKGGMAIVHVGGDREGHVGLFSHNGHYVVAAAYDGEDLCILDPAYRPGRYEEEGRRGKAKVDEPFVYCKPETVLEDTLNRTPHFHLFFCRKPA
ncbi:MAG: hypothetical protein II776_07415, partial [Clostridia bacterium]|nr:hypothetical protein [Clostridia bacterium]